MRRGRGMSGSLGGEEAPSGRASPWRWLSASPSTRAWSRCRSLCRCLRLAAVGLAAACPSLRCLGAGSGSACSSAPKAAPGGLPSSWGLDKAGGRQGFIAGEDSEPLPPPHLYSAPQGGAGSSGYWSWSRFICKCCVCKRSALTPGAVPAAVPRPHGDLGGRPVPPPVPTGTLRCCPFSPGPWAKDAARGCPPQGLSPG